MWDLGFTESFYSMSSKLMLVLVLLVSTAARGLSPVFARIVAHEVPHRAAQNLSKPTITTKGTNAKRPLEACIDTCLEQGNDAILLVDANNVRGKTDFEWTNHDLLQLLRAYKRSQKAGNLEIICVMDHGSRPQTFPYDFGLLVWAGPNQTADDVIAAATRWLTASADDACLFVITSDRELRQRCLRNNCPGNTGIKKKRRQKDSIKVFPSTSLVSSLSEQKIDLQQCGAGEIQRQDKDAAKIEARFLELEVELRQFSSLQPFWSLQNERQADTEQQEQWHTRVLRSPGDRDRSNHDAGTPLRRHMWNEKTWNRVLFAEHFRRSMVSSSPEKSPLRGGHLGDFQRKFKSKNAGEDGPISMFLDHRIESDPYQQQALLHYLDKSVASTTRKSSGSFPKTIKGNSHQSSADADSSADLLRKLVLEYPHLSQDDLVSRYIEQGSSRLQFSRTFDLLELLTLVAKQEATEDALQWSLRMQSADRSRRRPTGRQTMGQYRPVVDEALVQIGQVMEDRWFDLAR